MLYFLIVFTIVHAIYEALNPRARRAGHRDRLRHRQRHRVRASGPTASRAQLAIGAGPSIIGAWGATRPRRRRLVAAEPARQPHRRRRRGVRDGEPRGLGRAATTCPTPAARARYRGGAAILHDVMWRVPAEHRMQLLFHSRRPPAGGGVHGGRSGPTTTAWLFDGEISDGGTTTAGAPHRVHDDVYRRCDALRRRDRSRDARGRPRRREPVLAARAAAAWRGRGRADVDCRGVAAGASPGSATRRW